MKIPVFFMILILIMLPMQKSVNAKCRKLPRRVAFYSVECRDSCGEIFVDLQSYSKVTTIFIFFIVPFFFSWISSLDRVSPCLMIIQLELSSFDPFLQFNLVLSTHRCTFYLEGLYLVYHIARSDESLKSLLMLLQKKNEETIECQLQYPSFEVCCIKVSKKNIWSCLAAVLFYSTVSMRLYSYLYFYF